MHQKDSYKVLAQKLGIKQMSLKDCKLSDGKIYVEYFKQVFKQINRDILANKYNNQSYR